MIDFDGLKKPISPYEKWGDGKVRDLLEDKYTLDEAIDMFVEYLDDIFERRLKEYETRRS